MTRDLSIKRKLMAVVMLTSITVLILTVAAFMTYDLVTFRESMVRNLSTLARAIANNSTAALAFRNERDARDVLSSLRAEPQVVSAAFYDAQGKIFVTYPATASTKTMPSAIPEKRAYRFTRGYLDVYEPVTENNEWLGVLYLRADLRYFYDRLKVYSGLSALIVLGSLTVALLLSSRLQQGISRPLMALAETAKVVSQRGDYSVRATKISDDELGLLTDAFNQMLTRIQEQSLIVQESRARLSGVIGSAMDAIISVDSGQKIRLFNSAAERMFKCSSEDAIGKPLDNFIPARFRDIHPEHIREFGETGVTARAMGHLQPLSGLRFNGEEFPIEASISQIVVAGERIYTVILRDITERVRAQEASAFLAAIVNSSIDAIIGKDLNGRVVSWNSGAEHMFGYTAQEMVGQMIERIVSPDRPNEEQHILEEVRLGHTQLYETVRLHKSGRPVHISLTVSPIRDPSGKIVAAASISRDISERFEAQEALERQSRILREQAQMLDLANVLARDLDDRIILWNTGMEKMYGWLRSEALGRISHQLLRTHSNIPLEEIKRVLLQHGQWEGELIHTRKDGRQITVTSLWVLHKDEQGRPAASLEINTDITERKKAEEEILRINSELEQRVQERTAELTAANNELEAFTYSVAHDLRAPLRHIDAFSRILTEDFSDAIPQEARRHLDIIRKGSQNMSRLVDDLLNLARVGRQELKFQPTPLNPLVEDVLQDIKGEAGTRQIRWQIGPLATANVDPGLMKQVFANLLSNAVKYTRPRSAATIAIGKRQINGKSVIFVQDNGVGFNMKYADKLFGVFQRLHRADEFEGTGVGLAIVERVVRRHGGKIWAESEEGKGATFYFTLAGLDKTGKTN